MEVFNSYLYSNFKNDFYYKNKLSKESVIETATVENIHRVVGNLAKVLKVPTLPRKGTRTGTTDGVLEFYHQDSKDSLGFSLIECKRGINRDTKSYESALIQSFAYSWQLSEEAPIHIVVLATEKFFDYIIVEENEKVLNKLYKKIYKTMVLYTPSQLGKYISYDFSKLKIHRFTYHDEFDLKRPLTEIYTYLINKYAE